MPRLRAEFPSEAYRRPKRTDSKETVVTVVGENGESLGSFDFSRYPLVGTLRQSLILAFIKATSSGGRWRRAGSCAAGQSVIGTFLKFVEANHPDVESIEGITPEVWNSWRADLESRVKWPGQINLSRSLLADVEGLPEATQLVLRTRAPKPKSRDYNAYSREEFARIKRVYTGYVMEAEKRITSNVKTLIDYWNGVGDPEDKPYRARWKDWSKGQILDHLLTTGEIPKVMEKFPHHSGLKEHFGLEPHQRSRNLLFPSPAEILALVVLFICERGYNSSVVFGMEVPELASGIPIKSSGSVYTAHLDKPRRGPAKRYFTSNFAGNESRLMERAIRMTQPARYTLEQLGFPTNQLLIALGTHTTRHPSGIFITDWSTSGYFVKSLEKLAPVLGDDGTPLHLNLRRLRLTEQVHSQRSRQNSETVSEEIYRRSEPATVKQAVPVLLQGQQEALQHAQRFVEIRTVTTQELPADGAHVEALSARLGIGQEAAQSLLNGALDTATAACTDFFHSPFDTDQNGACAASFMMCLGCDNAVATPRHLPQLVVLFDALQSISSTVSEERWNREFAMHQARLRNLLSRLATKAEIAGARLQKTTETEDLISRLIGRELDA